MPPPFDRIESLFHEARKRAPGSDLSAWLDEHCGGDAELSNEVVSLLQAHTEMRDAPPAAAEPALPAGLFGPYRAVKLIGRGGMSAVFLAERVEGDFKQTVALKIMAAYLTGPEFLHRFENERRLLASLNHNHITRLLEGGVTPDGQSYLVTEYIDGEPIDDYCDTRKLSIAARLRIFLQVCDAVEHAHRNLIVHKDLKPANILVNSEGVVKLLDFGTASLLDGAGEMTVTRLRMMTPRYASPEQIRGERLNTSTDIFSLGVILYELLSGAWPFGDPGSALSEINRAVHDTQPTPPSTVITDESAESRSIPRAQLSTVLRGDLSAIVLKALENDPARRYESARAFAGDLENFLGGRPVLARPQTWMYRAAKFVRRQWIGVAAAAIFVIGLSSAAAVALHQANVARAEAHKAQRVADFLNEMLSSAKDTTPDPQRFTVAQMLEAAEPRLERSWGDDPLTRATLQRSLGASFLDIQELDRARSHLEKDLSAFEAAGDDREAASTLLLLGETAGFQGKSEESVKFYEDALARANRLGRAAPASLRFDAEFMLARELVAMRKRLPEAEKLTTDAVAIASRDSAIPKKRAAMAFTQLGWVAAYQGRFDESDQDWKRALALGEQEEPDGLWEEDPIRGLINTAQERGDYAEAAALSRHMLTITEKFLGNDNPMTAVDRLTWAQNLARSGKLQEALAQVEPAFTTARKAWKPENLNFYYLLMSAAFIYTAAEDYTKVESFARQAMDLVKLANLDPNDGRRADAELLIGFALSKRGRCSEGLPMMQQAETVFRQVGRIRSAERAHAKTEVCKPQ